MRENKLGSRDPEQKFNINLKINENSRIPEIRDFIYFQKRKFMYNSSMSSRLGKPKTKEVFYPMEPQQNSSSLGLRSS